MWILNLKSITKVADKVRLIVEFIFNDGKDSFDKEFIVSNEQTFKKMILAELDRINKLYDFANSLKLGTIDQTPEIPTQDEVEFQDWLVEYQKLSRVKNLVSLGVLTGSEADVLALKDTVKTKFKLEYLNLI